MDFMPIRRDLFTLLLALLFGAGVAVFSRDRGHGTPDAAFTDSGSASSRRDFVLPAVDSSAAWYAPQAVGCASAWEALKDGRLSHGDRIKAQHAILKEWVRHDLAAALVAFCLEQHFGSHRLHPWERFDPLPAMAADPATVEQLLKSGRLGLRAGYFRAYWFCHLAKADPVGILDRLDELAGGKRSGVLDAVVASLPPISSDPETWQAGMDRLSSILSRPAKQEFTDSIATALGFANSLPDLGAAYLATADPRLHDLLVSAAVSAGNSGDPFADAPELPAEVHTLPNPFRSAVIQAWTESWLIITPVE